MNCTKCSNQLPAGAKFCNKCGKPVDIDNGKEVVNVEFFSIPLSRLALLSILTLGIYEIFWFYRNWDAIMKAEKQKISPFWRAIFSVFYCHSFFKRVLLSAKKNGYSNSFSPTLLATIYIILLLLGNGLGRIENTTFGLDILWLLIATLAFIPLLPIQRAINFNNSKIVQNFSEKRKFSKGEIILTVIGSIWFLLVLLGIFSPLIPENSTVSSTSSYSTADLIVETVQAVKADITLPSKLDEVTTLVDVTAEPTAIRYHYVLSDVDVDKLSNSYLKNYLSSSICQNPDTKNLLDRGIDMEYVYAVENTTQTYFVSFSKFDCLK